MPDSNDRREFLRHLAAGVAAACAAGASLAPLGAQPENRSLKGQKMAYGLVTYQWGKDWTLEQLLENCERSGVQGVELRTTHKHGVEPALNEAQRHEVARRFADSPVTLVGLGSNERFDHPDPETLALAIQNTKAFLRLSHDVGSSGVKVKPDGFPDGVAREKTIQQIGRSLNEVARYGEGFGQQVRLEVHGQCAELPTIKAILDVADHPGVAICWNSNPQDLQGAGLRKNFELVCERFGATLHVRELDNPSYPFPELIRLLVEIDYEGWVMLESSTQPDDPVAALAAQRELFTTLVKQAQEQKKSEQ
jgi:sugar phosphate isomerase/epimerase